MFDWSSGKLTSVDAIGAALLAQNNHLPFQDGFPKGWLNEFSRSIEKTPFWVHNFCMGFNHGYQIWILPAQSVPGSMCATFDRTGPEDASKLGLLLRKEFR